MLTYLRRWFDDSKVLVQWQGRNNVFIGLVLATLFVNVLALVFPISLLQVYDRVIPNQAYYTLAILVILVIAAIVLEAVLRLLRSIVIGWAGARYEYLMGMRAYRNCLSKAMMDKNEWYRYYDAANEVNHLKAVYSGELFVTLLDLPFSLLFLALIAYFASVLVVVPIGIFIYVYCRMRYLARLEARLQQEAKPTQNKLLNFILELIYGIHSIKTMAMEHLIKNRYEKLQEEQSKNRTAVQYVHNAVQDLDFTVSQVFIVSMAMVGAFLILGGNMSLGGLAACILLANRALQPLLGVIKLFGQEDKLAASRATLAEVMQIDMSPIDYKQVYRPITGDIQFKDVCYVSQHNDFRLPGVSFHIVENSLVGLRGKALTGKTLLLQLIMGMETPSKGEIWLGNKNIKDYDPNRVASNMLYINDHPKFFAGSILDNITLFARERHEKQAREITRAIGLDAMIRQMPDGYDTEIGARASEILPASVMRMIAISRAFVHHKPVMIFDQIDNSIDVATFKAFMRMLATLRQHATVIFVSNHAELYKQADQIIEISAGNITITRLSNDKN